MNQFIASNKTIILKQFGHTYKNINNENGWEIDIDTHRHEHCFIKKIEGEYLYVY